MLRARLRRFHHHHHYANANQIERCVHFYQYLDQYAGRRAQDWQRG
jgi:hypothetical protein